MTVEQHTPLLTGELLEICPHVGVSMDMEQFLVIPAARAHPGEQVYHEHSLQ